MPHITTIGLHQYEVQPKNFWTQREMEKAFRDLYTVQLPKGARYSDRGFAEFVTNGLKFETREVLEAAFDVLFKPVANAPKISEVLATNTLSEVELLQIIDASRSFSGSSNVSGASQGTSAKPSKSSPRPKKKKA